jgi:dTDP-4-dehydrorhamnose 3,5-epimerase
MNIQPLEIADLLLVQARVFRDARGFFMERFRENALREHNIPCQFVQDNHSRSHPQVLRGLHFQNSPVQGKLVGAVRGAIWDVAVDLRPHSPTFRRWYGTELSDANGKMLWIPPGFAHGFCVLGNEPADVVYKVDAYYNPKTEIGVHWADPDIGIDWPIDAPIISDRDRNLPPLSSLDFTSIWNELHVRATSAAAA